MLKSGRYCGKRGELWGGGMDEVVHSIYWRTCTIPQIQPMTSILSRNTVACRGDKARRHSIEKKSAASEREPRGGGTRL